MEIWGDFASSSRLWVWERGRPLRGPEAEAADSFQHEQHYRSSRRNWPIKATGTGASVKYIWMLGTPDTRPIWAQCVPLGCGSPTAKGAVKLWISKAHGIKQGLQTPERVWVAAEWGRVNSGRIYREKPMSRGYRSSLERAEMEGKNGDIAEKNYDCTGLPWIHLQTGSRLDGDSCEQNSQETNV